MISLAEFGADGHGRRYADVLGDPRIDFQEVVDFFNSEERLKRMEDSEMHQDRPALAGVVMEFETVPSFDSFLSGNDAHTTRRFRQAVGVLVRMHMESRGWTTTGTKGSLGTREKVQPPTTTPGAYVNKHGLSKWFTRAERYRKMNCSE